jgi:hypothetical protein
MNDQIDAEGDASQPESEPYHAPIEASDEEGGGNGGQAPRPDNDSAPLKPESTEKFPPGKIEQLGKLTTNSARLLIELGFIGTAVLVILIIPVIISLVAFEKVEILKLPEGLVHMPSIIYVGFICLLLLVALIEIVMSWRKDMKG